MAQTKCPNDNCTWSGEPVMDMAPSGRVIPSCPECGFGFPVSEPPVSYGVSAVPSERPISGARGAYGHQATPDADDTDVVAMARRRLDAIEIQLTAARKLEPEAARLRRMIAAAEDTEDVSPAADH